MTRLLLCLSLSPWLSAGQGATTPTVAVYQGDLLDRDKALSIKGTFLSSKDPAGIVRQALNGSAYIAIGDERVYLDKSVIGLEDSLVHLHCVKALLEKRGKVRGNTDTDPWARAMVPYLLQNPIGWQYKTRLNEFRNNKLAGHGADVDLVPSAVLEIKFEKETIKRWVRAQYDNSGPRKSLGKGIPITTPYGSSLDKLHLLSTGNSVEARRIYEEAIGVLKKAVNDSPVWKEAEAVIAEALEMPIGRNFTTSELPEGYADQLVVEASVRRKRLGLARPKEWDPDYASTLLQDVKSLRVLGLGLSVSVRADLNGATEGFGETFYVPPVVRKAR